MTGSGRNVDCRDIAAFLDQELATATVSDSSLNGLQVQGRRPVRRLAVAVDACLETFQAAQDHRADMLAVHHGLFWGDSKPVTGILYERLESLLRTGMALYASHLPLDLHPRLGNNAQLAKILGITRRRPFGSYHGQTIGFGGHCAPPAVVQALAGKLEQALGRKPKVFPLGPKKIRRLAIISGGGGDLIEQAAAEGYDAFLTGEVSHQAYHPAKELKINLILAGHYATETLGVRMLGRAVEKKFGIQSIFIDIPTSM